MSSILQEIESQIAGVKTAVMKQNVGTVREIGDGVAKVEGLTDAMYNEMLDFGDGVTGLVLNLVPGPSHHEPRTVEAGLQQVRMAREQLPQNRQNALVGKQHFPRRLNPHRLRRTDVLAELLADHPFPRVEFEHRP